MCHFQLEPTSEAVLRASLPTVTLDLYRLNNAPGSQAVSAPPMVGPPATAHKAKSGEETTSPGQSSSASPSAGNGGTSTPKES